MTEGGPPNNGMNLAAASRPQLMPGVEHSIGRKHGLRDARRRVMVVTLQGILQTAFAPFAHAHRQPPRVWRAACAVMRCRTAALGGHVRRCPAGHVTAIAYNACRHRACPRCGRHRGKGTGHLLRDDLPLVELRGLRLRGPQPAHAPPPLPGPEPRPAKPATRLRGPLGPRCRSEGRRPGWPLDHEARRRESGVPGPSWGPPRPGRQDGHAAAKSIS